MATLSVSAPVAAVTRPSMCGLVIFAGDFLSILVSFVIAVLMRLAFDGEYDPWIYWRVAPTALLFIAGYALFGLYPGIAYGPVREIRQVTIATTLVFVLLGTLLFLVKEAPTYSRSVFVITWMFALFLVPLTRAGVRGLYGKRDWWGYPIAIFGSGENADRVVRELQRRPGLGLHPVAVFEHAPETSVAEQAGASPVAVRTDMRHAAFYARQLGLKRALISMPDLPESELMELLETHARGFSRVYVVSGLPGLSSLGIEPRDICDTLALELRRNLLLPSRQVAKRAIDQLFSAILLVVCLPLLALIVLLIRLESKGSAFYSHKRIGHGGKEFKMLKFRTMYTNGDRILEEHLEKHPEHRAEWAANRKLRHDPRVTKLGRILRKTSLDELPQLWNVLRGQMSLVGPRPIVRAEIDKFGHWFGLYCRVVPGLTGLWQVSGRSDTNYQQRVELDTYYIRNWSPWFDIYLLARTFRVVLRGEGAY